MLFYIAGRPQTIVSLLNVGRLPDQLPKFVEPKALFLFSNRKEAVNSIKLPNVNQLFLVEVEVANYEEGFVVSSSSEGETVLQMSSILTSSIKKIILNSKTSEKLLLKLLNGEIHVPIEFGPGLFACNKVKIVSEDSNPVDFFPSFDDEIHHFDGTHIPIELGPDLFASNKLKAVAEDSNAVDFSPSFGNLIPLKNQIESNVKIIRKGDILGSTMQTLINTVNCVGVMGKGLAFLFKQAYPDMFEDYKKKCDQKKVKIGRPYLFKISASQWVLNFPTKNHWKNDSKIEYIEAGLKYLAAEYNELGITSLAVPPLGCGNGGLNWEQDVFPLVKKYLFPLNIPIEVYTPFVKPSASKKKSKTSEQELCFRYTDSQKRSRDLLGNMNVITGSTGSDMIEDQVKAKCRKLSSLGKQL